MESSFPIKLLTWIGIVAISVQLNTVPVSVLLFRLNQEDIVRTHCERKTPHCNGNCYLLKQLANTHSAKSDSRAPGTFVGLDKQFLTHSELALTAPSHSAIVILRPSIGELACAWTAALLDPPRLSA